MGLIEDVICRHAFLAWHQKVSLMMLSRPYLSVLCFIALGCGLGLLLSRLVNEEVISVAAFGITMIVVGLSVARFKVIDKLAADRLYYVFGIVGICAFFASEVPKRLREQLQVQYVRDRAALDEVTHDLALVELVAERPEVLLSRMREGIKRKYSAVLEEASSEECRRILADPPRGEHTNPMGDVYDRCLLATWALQNNDWSVAEELTSLREVETNRKRLNSLPGFSVVLAEETLPWPEVAEILFGESEDLDLERRREELLAHGKELEAALSINIDAHVFPEEVKYARFQRFLSRFWPVLLITLVGLKLSRPA